MEREASPLRDHLREIAWAVFLIDLVLLLLALLFRSDFGTRATLALFGTLAAAVTLFFVALTAANLLYVFATDRLRRRAGRRPG